MAPPLRIFLYEDPRTPIAAPEVAAHLRSVAPRTEVTVRREFFQFWGVGGEELDRNG